MKSLGWAITSWLGRCCRRPVILLLAISAIGFFLRTVRLDFQPLWWDEGWSVYFATADIPTMIARTAIDIHPPFYYVVLHLWTLFLGSSAVSVRFFSVAIGTLSIPMIFLVGRRLLGVRVGVMAALTMALAPFHVYYSQEVRMYALVTLLVLVSVYLFLALAEGKEDASSSCLQWVLYIVVTSTAMYTQYYAVFVPVFQTILALLWLRQRRRFVVNWLGAQVVLLLVYLPWLMYAGGQLAAYVGTKMVKEGDVPLGLWAYFQQHLLAFSVGHLSESGVFLSWLSVVFISLLALGIVGHFRFRGVPNSDPSPRTYEVAFCLLYLLIPVCLGYAVNLRYPFTSPRIQRLFLFSAPALYLLVALGLAWAWERFHAVWPACVLLLVVSAPPLVDLYTVERYVGEDYRLLIEKVQALARPDDVIVAVHPWQIGYFHAYYHGQLPSLYLTPKEATDVTSEKWAADSGLMAQELDALLAQHRFLWFPAHQTLGRVLESDVEAYLSEAHYPVLGQWFSESTRLSGHTGGGELSSAEGPTNFGDKISLLRHGLTSTPVEAAWGTVLADLRWKIMGDLDGKYQISLRLADAEGRTWASRDSEPVGGLRPFHDQAMGSEMADHQGLLIPAGTPPGSYELRLGLYRLENGRWLDILDPSGAPTGVEAVLGTVEVLASGSPPSAAALFVEHPQQADFASGLRFLGYSLKGETFKPGDALEMTLFWEALVDLDADYYSSVRLEDGQGRIWAVEEAPPAGAAYPTSRWTKGQLARGIHSLLIPATVPGDVYRISLSLHSSADGRSVPLRRWGLDWGDRHLLGTVEVRGRPHRTDPPASIGNPMTLRLGEVVRFLGYDLDRQEVHPGESLYLTLYWQALNEMDTSYSVFNHLIDGENRIWGQIDGIPGGGTLPTSSWIEGEYVVDVHEIPVRDDALPGWYLIETGMYDLATMLRLPVFDDQGTVIGDRILLEATPIRIL